MRVLFLFILLLTLAGCKNKDKVPSGVLSAEEMVPVLVDLHVFESVKGRIDLFKDSIPEDMIETYKIILAENEIPEDQLVSSYSYYAEKKPEQLITIYDSVLVRLAELENVSMGSGVQEPTYPEQQSEVSEKKDISKTFKKYSNEGDDELNSDSLLPKPEKKKVLQEYEPPNQ